VDFFHLYQKYGYAVLKVFVTKFHNPAFEKFFEALRTLAEGEIGAANLLLGKREIGSADGQLSVKSEPAGKERVFALVDI